MLPHGFSFHVPLPWRALAMASALAALLVLAGTARGDDPKPDQAPPPAPDFGLPDLEDLLKNLPIPLDDLLKNLPFDLDPQQAEDFRKQMRQMHEQMRKAFGERFNQGGGQFRFQFGMPFQGAAPARARPGRLGAGVAQPGAALADQLGLPDGEGVVVGQVHDGSPAAKAGLKVNDILLKLGGKAVPSDPEQFRQMVEGIKPNAPVDAVILRKGKQQTLKGLTLPPRGPEAGRPGLKRRPRPKGTDIIRLAPEVLPCSPAGAVPARREARLDCAPLHVSARHGLS